MKRTNAIAHLALGMLLLHAIWLGLYLAIATPVLPAPWAVYRHLAGQWDGDLWIHLVASAWRIIQGIGYSLIIAFTLALLMYRYRTIRQVLEPLIYFTYPIPKLALLPVVMILMGLGEATKVTMIVLIILFQMVVGIRDGFKGIPRESQALMRSLGASWGQQLRHLLLPAITPSLLGALRIAIGTAVSVLFVTETYGTTTGMGYYIIDAWMRVDYLEMYGAIALLSLIGFLLFVLTDLVEHILCRWMR